MLQIIGDGVFSNRLREQAERLGLDHVEFTGWRPRAEMPDRFMCSDVLIISLKSGFDLTIPAKFQAYIASGRPIFGAVRGDLAELIRSHDIGLTADPDDVDSLAAIFRKFCDTPPETFLRWQKNALAFSDESFCREKILQRMTALLTE